MSAERSTPEIRVREEFNISVYFSAAHEALVARGREEGQKALLKKQLEKIKGIFLKTRDTYRVSWVLTYVFEYSPEDAQALIQEWSRELPNHPEPASSDSASSGPC